MSRNIVLLPVMALLLGIVRSQNVAPTIRIAQGTLAGKVFDNTNVLHGTYFAYQGIPYAKPPVGELRFKNPVPAEPWNDTYQATKERAICKQPELFVQMSNEDCLYLNVYIPQVPDPKNLLPVMVWIHGGSFGGGSGNLYRQDPVFLLNNGIVYVSLNYRLSVFGFLSTEDEEVPGNWGLKDQLFALRWIKENIQAFGGDTNKITIFGESAGGASVSLHLVSPASAGMFRAVIAESGSAASEWVFTGKDLARQTAFTLGKNLGYTGNSSQELVEFLRTVDSNTLLQATSTVTVAFFPVVEPVGKETFISENPIKMLAEGNFNKVPYLSGLNSGEAILFLAGILAFVPVEDIDKNFLQAFKSRLRYCKFEPCGDEMIAKVKSFYFGDEQISKNNLQTLINLITDMMYGEGTIYMADKLSSLGDQPVYVYEFSFEGKLGAKASMAWAANYTGAAHGDELPYIFDYGIELEKGLTDAIVRQDMSLMWSNFAKYLNPTPDAASLTTTWLPYTQSAKYYLDINANSTLKTDYRKKYMDFIQTLYSSS